MEKNVFTISPRHIVQKEIGLHLMLNELDCFVSEPYTQINDEKIT